MTTDDVLQQMGIAKGVKFYKQYKSLALAISVVDNPQNVLEYWQDGFDYYSFLQDDRFDQLDRRIVTIGFKRYKGESVVHQLFAMHDDLKKKTNGETFV